ncbi:immunity 53 family protein [Alteromonas sp. a30]|uniref:immunity 53 family protein n=1 Tax=Alteromonas sp. a30 TaxID=2730917 RepID=UPI00227EE1C8|nr:immunity 53 family protein [Alteromonas sp. a30]MCY7296084.1 rhodanese-related sulfurtransferase [Alteromonas sp. a30]
MNTLEKIMNWYASNCDGDWEHSFGVKIDTLDNPGWTIQVDIAETGLSGKCFDEVDIQRSETNWIYCNVSDDVFKGAGGTSNLEELIKVFLNWAENG